LKLPIENPGLSHLVRSCCHCRRCRLLASISALLVLAAACGKKVNPQVELSHLETEFATAGSTNPVLPDTTAYLNTAIAAVRENDYADGVIALQALQRVPGVTPEQRRTVQEAMQRLTDDLLKRAERGDARAQAQLAAIERTRSQ
jgi:hypothetical protein